MSGVLAGRGIWITRAPHQAAAWASIFAAAGARPICEPLLAIDPPCDERQAARALSAAENADLLIATSSNAVEAAWRIKPDLSPMGRLFAVGEATARALERTTGRTVHRPRAGYSSEALLADERLRVVADHRIALLGGSGGRTTLADTLSARGATVEKLALYRRRFMAIEAECLAAILEQVDAVVITSGEMLTHLADRVHASDRRDLVARLTARRLVAPSERVVQLESHRLQWSCPPVVVDRFGARTIVDALARVWTGGRE